MKVSQESINIADILRNKIITVPLYQRENSWNFDQVSDLFYITITNQLEGHFLGSLLLYKENDSGSVEIGNGQ